MVDQAVAPIRAGERLKSLDVLRGFALMGILVPNIVVFGWPSAAMKDPSVIGAGSANELSFTITSLVFTSKFRFLFAMLFGAGVIVYARKYDDADHATKLSHGAKLWYKRCAILLGFGLLHAYGLWFGDILTWYALAGLTILWWVRRVPMKYLLLISGSLLTLSMLITLGLYLLQTIAMSQGHMSESQSMFGDPKREIELMRGSWFDGFTVRAPMALMMHFIFVPLMMPNLLGIMTLGMALCRSGVLAGKNSNRWYLITGAIALAIGATLTALWWIWTQSAEEAFIRSIRVSFVWMPGIPLGLGYGMFVIAMSKTRAMNIISTPLAAVGRMALTNYFLHTLLCTTFFYGYGFGYFASIEYPQLWIVIGAVWIVNIVFSLTWLRFFRFGPFEWIWRCMTYGKLLPILHSSSTPVQQAH